MLCASRQRRELKITSLASVVVERSDKGLERLKIVEEISSFLGLWLPMGRPSPTNLSSITVASRRNFIREAPKKLIYERHRDVMGMSKVELTRNVRRASQYSELDRISSFQKASTSLQQNVANVTMAPISFSQSLSPIVIDIFPRLLSVECPSQVAAKETSDISRNKVQDVSCSTSSSFSLNPRNSLIEINGKDGGV